MSLLRSSLGRQAVLDFLIFFSVFVVNLSELVDPFLANIVKSLLLILHVTMRRSEVAIRVLVKGNHAWLVAEKVGQLLGT